MSKENIEHTEHKISPLGEKKRSPFKEGGMFNEAHPLVFARAKELRKKMTHAEMILWGYLKGGINSLRFRRQHPINKYIADFYCHKLKLVIEADGSVHNDAQVRESDLERENNLKQMGYTIMRFTNEMIEKGADKVLEEIENFVARNYKQD